jgi:carbamoyltransferase
MWALGIGGLLHDGAAALLHHGEVVAAIEEEKLSRRPHGGGLPQYAIDACLDIAGVDSEQLDCVVLARPLGAPEGSPFHLHVKSLFPKSRIVIADHHVAHAAAAFYPSPFEQSKVLTLDRRGDMRSGAWWNAEGPRLSLVDELYASDSPAAFYSRVTELLGFRADREEHKVQWLSRAGGTRFVEPMIEMMGGASSTRPQVDHSYFDPARNTRGGFSDRFFKQLGISSSDRFSDEVRADLASFSEWLVKEKIFAWGVG